MAVEPGALPLPAVGRSGGMQALPPLCFVILRGKDAAGMCPHQAAKGMAPVQGGTWVKLPRAVTLPWHMEAEEASRGCSSNSQTRLGKCRV